MKPPHLLCYFFLFPDCSIVIPLSGGGGGRRRRATRGLAGSRRLLCRKITIDGPYEQSKATYYYISCISYSEGSFLFDPILYSLKRTKLSHSSASRGSQAVAASCEVDQRLQFRDFTYSRYEDDFPSVLWKVAQPKDEDESWWPMGLEVDGSAALDCVNKGRVHVVQANFVARSGTARLALVMFVHS